MKAQATLKNMCSADCSRIITRNLARIMNLRVIQIDTDARLLTFLYSDPIVLNKVRQELRRIGFPVLSLSKEQAAAWEEDLMPG
jgi:hypothetical protein